MIVDLVSFSFKKSLPEDTNYLIDVRFLNNPFYVDKLRVLDGLDKDVINFFEKDKDTQKFLNELFKWVAYIIEMNNDANKQKIVIAIGCTGGQHRSPYVTECLAKELAKNKSMDELSIYHKELKKYNVSTMKQL